MKIYELMKEIYDEMEGNEKRRIKFEKVAPTGIELGAQKNEALK